MNKMLIAAVLCAAACAGAPAARAATTPALSTMTDVQIYCMWAPYAAKCTTPAKPVAAKAAGHLYDCVWQTH